MSQRLNVRREGAVVLSMGGATDGSMRMSVRRCGYGLLGVVLSACGAAPSVHHGDFLVRSASDAQELSRYRVIDGDLGVASAFAAEAVLDGVEVVTGQLYTDDCDAIGPPMTSLTLPDLTHAGEIYIAYACRGLALRELALPRLRDVEQEIFVSAPELVAIGLGGLEEAGYVRLEANPRLGSVQMGRLVRAGALVVRQNPRLVELELGDSASIERLFAADNVSLERGALMAVTSARAFVADNAD